MDLILIVIQKVFSPISRNRNNNNSNNTSLNKTQKKIKYKKSFFYSQNFLFKNRKKINEIKNG